MQLEQRIQENERLCEWAVKKFIPAFRRERQEDYEDWTAIATAALWQAAEAFDPSRGLKFSTLAATCMRNALLGVLKKAQRWGNPHLLWSDLDASTQFLFSNRPQPPDWEQPEELEQRRTQARQLIESDCLNPKQKRVARLLWVQGLSLVEAAKKLGVSDERVRVVRNNVVAKLKRQCGVQ